MQVDLYFQPPPPAPAPRQRPPRAQTFVYAGDHFIFPSSPQSLPPPVPERPASGFWEWVGTLFR